MNSFWRQPLFERLEDGVLLEHIIPPEIITEEIDESDGYVFGQIREEKPFFLASETNSAVEQLHMWGFIGYDTLEQIRDELLPSQCGSSVMDLEYVLREVGFEVEKLYAIEIEELIQCLAQDNRVICSICKSTPFDAMFPVKQWVEVVGVDLRILEAPSVCLCSAEGIQNESLCEFIRNWDASGRECYVIFKGEADDYK